MMPKVSIITAAHNAEKYIGKTIESVLAQSYDNWNYIIVDDGSDDATFDIVNNYSFDRRIIAIRQEKKGKTVARNLAFKHCNGSYIANIDADDLWHKDKLGRQVDIMDNNKHIGLVYTAINYIDTFGNIISSIYPKNINPEPLYQLLTSDNPITHSSILVRRDAFSEDRYQDENIELVDELIIYLKIGLVYKTFYLINQPLTYYRIHEGSEYRTISVRDRYNAYRKIFDTFYKIDNLPSDLKALKAKSFAWSCYSSAWSGIDLNKDLSYSLTLLLRAVVIRPNYLYRALRQVVKLCLFRKKRLCC